MLRACAITALRYAGAIRPRSRLSKLSQGGIYDMCMLVAMSRLTVGFKVHVKLLSKRTDKPVSANPEGQ